MLNTQQPSSLFRFLEVYFLPVAAPLLLALVLGPAVAYFIVEDQMFFAIVIVALIPGAILFNRYALIALILWFILVPLLPFGRVANFVYWVIHRLMVPGAFGVLLVVTYVVRARATQPVKLGIPELAMAGFVGLNAVHLMWLGESLRPVFTIFDRVAMGYIGYLLLRYYNPRPEQIRRFVPLFVFICISQCIIGLVGWFAPSLLPQMWRFESLEGARTVGTFGNPAAFTSTLMLTMIFIFNYAIAVEHEGNIRLRNIMYAIFGFGAICIFFSMSRGSWLSGILAVAFLGLLYPRQMVSLLMVVVPISIVLSGTFFQSEVAWAIERLNTEQTKESRIILANAGRQMFLAKPVLGWGYANYDDHDWKFMQPTETVAPTQWDVKHGTSHSTYLTILAETGAMGFLLYVFPLFWWLGMTFRYAGRVPDVPGFGGRRFLISLWAFYIFYATATQFMDMRFFLFPQNMLWINLGFIAAILQNYINADGYEETPEAQEERKWA